MTNIFIIISGVLNRWSYKYWISEKFIKKLTIGIIYVSISKNTPFYLYKFEKIIDYKLVVLSIEYK